MFRRIFGVGTQPTWTGGLRPTPLLGGFDVEVVGESNYQAALSAACGGLTRDGVEYDCVAVLRAEPGNPYDPNAIRVEVDGRLVGYLNKHAAKAFRPTADRLARQGQVGTCQARIVGGWDRGADDVGSFGIWLDLGVN
jgi:hypothetical protein